MIRIKRAIAALLAAALALASPASAQFALNPFAPTYQSMASYAVDVSTTTDIFCIEGPATGALRVLRFAIQGTMPATSQNASLLLIMRSSLNTGGTSVANPIVSRDSRDPAATFTFRTWTVKPAALGTAIGTLDQRFGFWVNGSTVSIETAIYDFTTSGKFVSINGPAEALCLTASSSFAGGSVRVTITAQQGPG